MTREEFKLARNYLQSAADLIDTVVERDLAEHEDTELFPLLAELNNSRYKLHSYGIHIKLINELGEMIPTINTTKGE